MLFWIWDQMGIMEGRRTQVPQIRLGRVNGWGILGCTRKVVFGF